MEQNPQRDYRIVEREGRLVVEPNQGAAPSRQWFPVLALPNLSWRHWGLKLIQKRHYFDHTTDGDAILSADSLSTYLDLDARSYDLYYVTQHQQALLGWLGVVNYAAIAAFALFYFLVGILDFPILLIVMIFGGAFYAGQYFLRDAIESLSYQRYEPTEAEPPASEPAPSAPAP